MPTSAVLVVPPGGRLATGGRPRVLAGEVSKKQAARMLSVSKSTVLRLLRAGHEGEDMQIPNATTGRNGGANTGVQNPVENDLAEGA